MSRLPDAFFHNRSACASTSVDPELFFPVSPGAGYQIAEAKRVCAECPVQPACLDFALHSDVVGVWGGTTRPERAQLRRISVAPAGEVAA